MGRDSSKFRPLRRIRSLRSLFRRGIRSSRFSSPKFEVMSSFKDINDIYGVCGAVGSHAT